MFLAAFPGCHVLGTLQLDPEQIGSLLLCLCGQRDLYEKVTPLSGPPQNEGLTRILEVITV